MNFRAHLSVLVIYALLSAAVAFALNHVLLQTDHVVGDAMLFFGTAVFLLPVIWAGPFNSVVAIYLFGYLVSTLVTLFPFAIGWKRGLGGKGLSILVWAALWVVSGFVGTFMLDKTSSI